MKEFSFKNRKIETRLLVHHDDGDWAGYTYVWNQNQSDADLATGAQQVDLGDGGARWSIPSQEECLACHTPARGRVLGLESGQMNKSIAYPTGRVANQLATLAHLGMIDASFRQPQDLGAMPSPHDTTADLAARARSYLHSNCAQCHPGPGSQLDLLYDTPLSLMNVCDVKPAKAHPGGTRVVKPGDPDHSVLTLRMKALNEARMPKIGTGRVDKEGVKLLESWIDSLKRCGAKR